MYVYIYIYIYTVYIAGKATDDHNAHALCNSITKASEAHIGYVICFSTTTIITP
jgi:hypothetical protein